MYVNMWLFYLPLITLKQTTYKSCSSDISVKKQQTSIIHLQTITHTLIHFLITTWWTSTTAARVQPTCTSSYERLCNAQAFVNDKQMENHVFPALRWKRGVENDGEGDLMVSDLTEWMNSPRLVHQRINTWTVNHRAMVETEENILIVFSCCRLSQFSPKYLDKGNSDIWQNFLSALRNQ